MATPPGGLASPSRRVTRTPRGSYIQYYIIIALVMCCLLSLAVNFLHGSTVVHSASLQALDTFKDQHLRAAEIVKQQQEKKEPNIDEQDDDDKPDIDDDDEEEEEELQLEGGDEEHTLAGLNCDAYGGPSPELAQEMVYWSDIKEDSTYKSPFYPSSNDHPRYMTFEPDGGGWNNIRMSMETVLAMAHAMGRTLVLPPEQRMYLLDKGANGKDQRKEFSFSDFFHMDSISREHEGLEIISTREFLEREALKGNLVDRSTGQVSFPPNNRTDWNGDSKTISQVFSPWLRSVAHMAKWNPDKCLAGFPSSQNQEDIEALEDIVKHVKETGGCPSFEKYIGKPTPVDASAEDRFKENCAERNELCIYDKEMQQDLLVHFSGKEKFGGRLLVHFYAFLFFEDWRQDLWMKRFVRDHVRYVDELQCAAARVVHAVRERAKSKKTSEEGLFDAFHVRRGDFQYTETRIEAEKLYEVSKDELTEGATVYMATDERDKSFFKPLADHYDLVFLDDFKHLFEDLNTNYYGMLDQLIASRGRVFFGCWFSTFSSYINRMRGYHVDKLKLPGHEHGLVDSYYYARPGDKMKMREFYPVKKTFHSREYPTAWRGIDEGIGLLQN